ncbi:MAG: helix-hairpin-helix domain-containing protein [Firmicutes bacterium]|nr:helix-hairpin-helix domain-containing protein [Bacillota bacterium]
MHARRERAVFAALTMLVVLLSALLGIRYWLRVRSEVTIIDPPPAAGPVEEVQPKLAGGQFRDPAGTPGEAGDSGDDGYRDRKAAPEEILVIHVAGAVIRPGVYRIPAGSRVVDAVEAAGGITSQGDLDLLNLAEPLQDAAKVYVPIKGEAPPAGTGGGTGAGTIPGKINLNRAGLEEFTSLPGIGPSKAGAIVEYRRKNGPFRRIEDLMRVPGIKEGTFEQLRGLVTVSQERGRPRGNTDLGKVQAA